MPVDTSKQNQKLPIQSGEILFSEGQVANSLNVLHEGVLILEKKSGNSQIPICQIQGVNSTPGIISLFTSGRYPYTIKAVQNSVISTYQVNSETIRKTVSQKVSLGITIARTLLREIIEIYKKNNQIVSATELLERYNDSMSLAYYLINPTGFPDIDISKPVPMPGQDILDPVVKRTKENLSKYLENGGKLPDYASIAFLNDDKGELLGKEYLEEIEIAGKEFHFLRKIMSMDPKFFTPLFEADPSLLIYVCEQLSEVYFGLLKSIDDFMFSFQNEMSVLISGNQCIVEKFKMMLDLLETGYSSVRPEILVPITENLIEKSGKFLSNYKTLTSSDYSGISESLSVLKEKSQKFSKDLKPTESAGNTETKLEAGVDVEAIGKEMEQSASKIINFAGLQPEKIKEFSALMIKLKQMTNPLDSDPDSRKIRRNITKTYWEIYQTCFIKYIQSGKKVPKPVEMMLQYGYFDETLLEKDQLAYLYTSSDRTKGKENIPISDGMHWLEKIYKKEIPTSLDELGQTYFEKIKMDLKDSEVKKESDLPATIDTPEARLKYELLSMYEANVKLTSGSIATHLPILTKYHVILPLDKCRVTKNSLTAALEEILSIDYTAFNREVIYNNEETGIRKEFIQRSIMPDFVLVPSIGTKIMMWQDLSVMRGSGSKESRGRIIIPMFVTGDLKVMLIDAISKFRWILCKDILGPDWNNPGIPSITSEYMDYLQFYHKNKDLSIELKEKIRTEMKRFRNDEDKFANDYQLWIRYESEGVQRLNRVVRNIFYKHIPFPKEIRDKLSKMPAYAEIHNRFVNIRTRHYRELENRYKKYINTFGSLPPELQENIDFYKV